MRAPLRAVTVLALTSAMTFIWGAGSTSAMDIIRFGDQLVMSGDVVGDECDRLRTALDAHPDITTVVLRNSHGGNADSGYCVGELLRARGVNTAVSGHCNSSCSRMFLGGVQRQFTDDEPATQTWIALHSNYDKAGLIKPGAPERLQAWIAKYSDGKADERLVEIWTHIENHQGFVYFFDSKRVPEGRATLSCTGYERGPNRLDQCTAYPHEDAYGNGIATSSELVHSNDRHGVAAAERY
jgi:hypothetical protein